MGISEWLYADDAGLPMRQQCHRGPLAPRAPGVGRCTTQDASAHYGVSDAAANPAPKSSPSLLQVDVAAASKNLHFLSQRRSSSFLG